MPDQPTTEVLLLADDSGNTYALPREALEKHRLTEAQLTALKTHLGDDVAGYAFIADKLQARKDRQTDAPLTDSFTDTQSAETITDASTVQDFLVTIPGSLLGRFVFVPKSLAGSIAV